MIFSFYRNQTALYYLDTQLIELALKQNNLSLARKRMSEAIQPDYVEPNMQHIRNRYLQHYLKRWGISNKPIIIKWKISVLMILHVMSVLKCVQLKLI